MIDNSRVSHQLLVSSSLASLVSTFITNPLEVAKLNMQYYPLICPSYPHSSYAQFTSCDCSRYSFVGALKSLKMVIPQTLLCSVLFMQLYENVRSFFVNRAYTSGASTILASACARFVVTTLNVPLDVIRIRLSNDIKLKSNLPSFNGFRVTLLRDMIYSLLYWTLFEQVRNHLSNSDYRRTDYRNSDYRRTDYRKSVGFDWDSNLRLNFIPGFTVAAIVSLFTNPLDVLKTRVQSIDGPHRPIWGALVEIYQKEKLLGLFSGVSYRMVKNGLHTSLYMTILEWGMKRDSFL